MNSKFIVNVEPDIIVATLIQIKFCNIRLDYVFQIQSSPPSKPASTNPVLPPNISVTKTTSAPFKRKSSEISQSQPQEVIDLIDDDDDDIPTPNPKKPKVTQCNGIRIVPKGQLQQSPVNQPLSFVVNNGSITPTQFSVSQSNGTPTKFIITNNPGKRIIRQNGPLPVVSCSQNLFKFSKSKFLESIFSFIIV